MSYTDVSARGALPVTRMGTQCGQKMPAEAQILSDQVEESVFSIDTTPRSQPLPIHERLPTKSFSLNVSSTNNIVHDPAIESSSDLNMRSKITKMVNSFSHNLTMLTNYTASANQEHYEPSGDTTAFGRPCRAGC
jgi:hypothetical protein